MSRPRFLADHDLNEHIVRGVLRRDPTVEFLRVRELGLAESPDSEVLEYAASRTLLVVSHDVNTMIAAALARIDSGNQMAGLLMVPQQEPVGAVIDSLLLIASASESDEWGGVIGFLPL